MRVQLIRSGGQLGKRLQSVKEVEMTEVELVKALKEAAPEKNLLARDHFHHSIIINSGEKFVVDVTKLAGKVKKLVEELEEKLEVF